MLAPSPRVVTVDGETLVAIVGWVLFIPVLVILYEDAKRRFGESSDGSGTATTREGSLDTLRDRYARGERGDEVFEARLDRLLETEDANCRRVRETRVSTVNRTSTGNRSATRHREPSPATAGPLAIVFSRRLVTKDSCRCSPP